ncbi:hypothetical protein B566_EDAN010820 [Ephemera danica]|nr:hypothetical protein B566_EDAN010820 [Ephemera danica]
MAYMCSMVKIFMLQQARNLIEESARPTSSCKEINLRWQVFKSRHEILLKLNNVNPTNSMILSVMMKDAQLTYELEMLKSCNSKISATDLKIHHVNVLKACMFQFEEKAKHVINLDQVKIFVGQVEQFHIFVSANYAIGIDLGTTNCCAAVYLDGKVVIVRNNIGWTTTPSTVYFGDQQHIFGESAINRGFDEPVNCVSEMKRIIGRRFNDPTVQSLIPRFSFKVKEDESGFPIVSVEKGEKRDWKPEEISALLLGEMCRLASILLDSLVFDAVVTIPAYFNELQREATKKACAIAGINVLRIINEPTAAAIAYGIQEPSDHPRNVLIFDFGGGTCDVSILSMEKKQYTVLSSYGDNQLGGEDVDDILMYHLVKVFEEKHPDMHIDVDDMQKLRRECERAKKELGCLQMTDVIVKRVLKSDIVYRETITRGTFHSLISPLFPRILNPIKKCLQEANLEAKDINEVVLVGGSSLLQPIQNILKEQFPGVQLHMQIRPDEAIAYGAAIQAAISSGKYFETHLIIKDITPFSLGIEENSRFFDVLIPKNTPLPASMVKEFCTTRNYQSVAQFNVYQGENRFVKNNTFLGSFELTNIRRAPAERTKFNVTFILDLDGILTVSAMEIGTNNSKEIKINSFAFFVGNKQLRGGSNLEQAQIQQWISFADSEILPSSYTWVFPCLGIMQFNKQST